MLTNPDNTKVFRSSHPIPPAPTHNTRLPRQASRAPETEHVPDMIIWMDGWRVPPPPHSPTHAPALDRTRSNTRLPFHWEWIRWEFRWECPSENPNVGNSFFQQEVQRSVLFFCSFVPVETPCLYAPSPSRHPSRNQAGRQRNGAQRSASAVTAREGRGQGEGGLDQLSVRGLGRGQAG